MRGLIHTYILHMGFLPTMICRRVALMLLLAATATCCVWGNEKERHDFEVSAYEIRTDLIHNHTFDLNNVHVADSLYAKSEKLNSTLGKLYALHIKYYALAGNGKTEEFNKAVDEFIEIALANEYYDEYFDAVSAKTQILMGHHEYAKCMMQAKDMLKTAQKVHNKGGLYESNMLVGQIYKHMNAWLIAEKYFLKALEAVRKMEDQDSIPYCLLYRELAECNTGAKNSEKALQYATKAKQWAPFDTYRYFCEWTYLSALYSSGNHEEFKKVYAKSELKGKDLSGNMDANMLRTMEIMDLVSHKRFAEALAKAKDIDPMDGLYNTLSEIHYYKGNYKQAYDYLLKQQTFTDSIEMNLLQSELAEIEARLGNTTLKYEAEQTSARMRLILAISISLILSTIIGFLTFNLIVRRKRNRRLLLANQAIEQKNAQLTEAKEATEKALVAAEKANAMRIHFIENMTHEIRTPLHAISGFAQVLTSEGIDSDSDEAREMKDIIMQNTVSLTQMLDNIIEISNFDSSAVNVKITETTVQNIIDTSINSTPQGNVTIHVDAQDAGNMKLTTDPALASKALSLILSNAVKFTKEGSITINAEKTTDDIRLIITDTGIGVPEDQAGKIFERFYKIDEFVPGAGLGLSLCRSIMKALGGSVNLDTTYKDNGSRFIITLPK